MKIKLTIEGDLSQMMQSEVRAGARAVTAGVRDVGGAVKAGWRAQVTGAGLGQRLANTIRGENYPKTGASLDAASLVYARPNRGGAASAADVVDAFDRGVLIKARGGRFVAIPTAAAGMRGMSRARITPSGWEARTGMTLRFVSRPGKNPILVADDARISKRGLAMQKKGKRRKDGILTGAMTVPIFILVPQVRLQKRLDLDRVVRDAEARLPAAIVAGWK